MPAPKASGFRASKLVTSDPRASGLIEAIGQIASFANLPRGWHYGTGEPLASSVFERAIAWIERLQLGGIRQISAAPLEDGGVFLEYHVDDVVLEISLFEDGSVSLFAERADQTLIDDYGADEQNAILEIGSILSRLCDTSDSLIHDIGTSVGIASKVQPLKDHRPSMVAARPSLMSNAPSGPAGRFARTFPGSTEAQPRIRRYSSSLTSPPYPQVAA